MAKFTEFCTAWAKIDRDRGEVGLREQLGPQVRVALGHHDRVVAEDGRQLLDRVARQHPLRREGVPRSLVPAWLGELELSERDAEIVSRRCLVDLLPVAAHGRDDPAGAAGLQFPLGENRQQSVEDRHDAGVAVLEGALDGLADVDASRGQVHVRPAQCEHLAGAKAAQGADCVGDIQRLG
ncbi:MAG TPA: hypothetical protein VKC58_03950 [Myxococcales bacterium]|nr:hypothetical protein [Myxococcales bacterium]